LLIFAEAANEAAGPDGNVGGFTARDIVKRSGAGQASFQPHMLTDWIKTVWHR